MDNFTIFTWLLTSVTIFGTYLNSRQNKYGFLIWGICNMLWLTVDFTRGIYAQAALYCVFMGFNIYGWVQWKKREKDTNLNIRRQQTELNRISRENYKLKEKYVK